MDDSGSNRDSVAREHRFHALPVKAIIDETHDTRTFVFDIPSDLQDLFAYLPGQYCTFRANIDGDDVLRSYSMSSTPDIDDELAVTVKRVPGGLMSNWLIDHVAPGDALEAIKPSGTFCLGADERPVMAFCGGSGVTPVFSIVKHALAHTDLPVRLLVANRDHASVIFHSELGGLLAAHPHRLDLTHHIDAERGYLDTAAIASFVGDATDAQFFICGPTPFMDLVEGVLLGLGVPAERIMIERFVAGGVAIAPSAAAGDAETASVADVAEAADLTETLVLKLKGKKHTFEYVAGDTVLQAARRGGLKPPFSCELGNCASCMALIHEGGATMKANNALTAAEVAEGWVLTCQAIPTGRIVSIEYEDL